ncbi:MAG: hypothetical protein OEU92_26515 [Alphaproteobacteria bacterium]|nr:hypothetical protein [Alphaproteobacteria bacterium]
MKMTARTSRNDEILQETAARLIHILGVDKAIYACRSNYWHGVLRFVLAYEKSLDRQPRPLVAAPPDGDGRRALSQTVTNRRHLIPKVASPAIAA